MRVVFMVSATGGPLFPFQFIVSLSYQFEEENTGDLEGAIERIDEMLSDGGLNDENRAKLLFRKIFYQLDRGEQEGAARSLEELDYVPRDQSVEFWRNMALAYYDYKSYGLSSYLRQTMDLKMREDDLLSVAFSKFFQGIASNNVKTLGEAEAEFRELQMSYFSQKCRMYIDIENSREPFVER